MDQRTLDRKMQAWISEATEDVLGLWQLCRSARYDGGAKTPEEVKTMVLGFVRRLLENGVQAVEIRDQRPWSDQNPDSVIERISREWDALGREPNVPDIVWFKRS
jgi:hypothetical protein